MAASRRIYTAQEVDEAVAALEDPDRFAHATQIVTHAAPSLARVLDRALADGGWYGSAHEEQLLRASGEMLVGVAVGFELAGQLADTEPTITEES